VRSSAASWIDARGITRCPSAYVATVRAALPHQIEAARIAAITVKPTFTRAENIELAKRSMRALFRY
jgi:hypothetical protein